MSDATAARPAPAPDAHALPRVRDDENDLRLERESWNDFRASLPDGEAQAAFDALWEHARRHARAIRDGHGGEDDYIHAALLAMLLETTLEARALRDELARLRATTAQAVL